MKKSCADRARTSLGAPLVGSLLVWGCTGELDADIGPDPMGEGYGTLREGLGTPGFEPIAPCLVESDYVSRAVVRFTGGQYTPRCLRLASGGTVVFQGSFAEHPLAIREGGDSPTPIVPTSSGGWAEFEFPDHGLFPYQCGAHPEEIGVIWSNYF